MSLHTTRPDSLSERVAPHPRPSLQTLLAGSDILEELTERPGRLLWEAYRAAILWAETPAGRRAELGSEGARAWWGGEAAECGDDSLARHLLGLAPLFGGAAVPPAAVAAEIGALARWCDQRGHMRATALLAEAAACVWPHDCAVIHYAGKTAKLAGWEAQAESWFRYGLTVARAARDGAQVASFLGALATYNHRRGNLRLSERLYRRALRAARRAGAPLYQAMMLHDLCLLLADRGRLAEAEAAAREAAELYGDAHPSLPFLMHDLAYAWMVHGRFEAAYPLMQAVLPHLSRADHRVRVVGNLARAAAARGDRERFEEWWRELEDAVLLHASDAGWADPLSDALREAAQGALTLGQRKRALWAASRGEPLAARARRGMDRLQMESVREAARRAEPLPAEVDDAAPHPEAASVETAAACVAILARRGTG